MIVIDASVLAEALTGSGRAAEAAREALGGDPRWAGPSLLKTETLSVIRGRLLGKKITQETADDAVTDLMAVVVDTVDENCLLPRIWELRGNLTAYDAAYVAAAEALGCSLVTMDARLSRAIGPRCPIQVVTS
ncbi:type II toxin-antitoxin system VapC family toxin [Sphaerisporangium aureirubrum]|uniref:Ribonuclease VapC n=1 Tax=Sphaerisporangium aureirubrum TaxID=1544736 RepID=A0ABW1NR94_9ACTN